MHRLFSHYGIIIMCGLFMAACSQKTTDLPDPPTPPKTPELPTKKDPKNPCVTFNDLDINTRDEVETAYVLYRDLAKLNKLDEAFKDWQKAYYGAPGSNGKVTYQFDDGVKIYTHFYNQETDPSQKRVYADSVMSIYDMRKECFGDEAYIEARKAFDYYYTFPGIKTEDEIFEMFKKNFDVNGKRADYFIVNPFTKLLCDKITAEEIPVVEGRKYAKQILRTVEYGVNNCEGRLCESWGIINEYAPARLEVLEGIDGFYDCEYYTNKYYNRFEASPEDCDIIGLVGRRLKRGGCTDDDPNLQKVVEAFKKNCRVAPVASCESEGYKLYNDGKYKEAIAVFEKCMAEGDNVKKEKLAMLMAKIYYRDIKDYPKSRKWAREVIKLNPNSGEAYLLIGKLYASSGPLCGSGRGWNSQVVTWPAIDKFSKAKTVDPSVAAEANKLIRQYKQYMPKKEDIFVRSIKAGDTFRVECWIQESTIVRTAD